MKRQDETGKIQRDRSIGQVKTGQKKNRTGQELQDTKGETLPKGSKLSLYKHIFEDDGKIKESIF